MVVRGNLSTASVCADRPPDGPWEVLMHMTPVNPTAETCVYRCSWLLASDLLAASVYASTAIDDKHSDPSATEMKVQPSLAAIQAQEKAVLTRYSANT
jgi:hypothetical protein